MVTPPPRRYEAPPPGRDDDRQYPDPLEDLGLERTRASQPAIPQVGPAPGAVSRPHGVAGPFRFAMLVLATALALAAVTTYGGSGLFRQGTTVPRPANWPSSVADQHASRLLPKVPAPAGRGGYRFVQTQADGDPVRYDPCQPIHYVVNPSGGPVGGTAMVRAAAKELARATGLKLTYDGPTREPFTRTRADFQPRRYGDRWAPVLIEWATAATDPSLAGTIAGMAGSSATSLEAGDEHYVTGQVVLDIDAFPADVRGPGARASYAIVLHELGHVVGLDHVKDRNQLMFRESDGTRAAFGPGDLRGLAIAGAGPCYPND